MKTKQSFTESLARIGLVINGTLNNPVILAAVEPFGYTEARVRTEGLGLYNKTQTEFLNFQKEYGEQYTAYEEMGVLRDKNYEIYMPILKLCRVGLKTKSARYTVCVPQERATAL